jgi:hypothetical protein
MASLPPEAIGPLVSAILTPIITLGAAWAVGNRLTASWGFWQKRREQALAATNDFYRLYGEFFAVWKLWDHWLRQSTSEDCLVAERGWKLLERAIAAEASMETMMVKLASERTLSRVDLALLGRFRQAFQLLRETMRERVPLNWLSSEHSEYLAFKELAVSVSRTVSTVDLSRQLPSEKQGRAALKVITSNRWEGNWVKPKDERKLVDDLLKRANISEETS